MQIYGRHFETVAMNGICFQDAIGLIKISISPKFLRVLMKKDLLHNIFESLRGIKQEMYFKSFQERDISESLPPDVENARCKAQK